MNKKFIVPLFSFSALITGCSFFSPPYQPPIVDLPTSTKSGVLIESGTTDFAQFAWWKKFNDPQLDNLILQALKNNNQIKMAHANIMQAQAQLKAAEYAWIPTLNAGGMGMSGNTYLTNMTPQGSFAQALPSGSMGNTNFSLLQGGFVPSYTLNIFANINQTKRAKASVELQKANANAIRLSIISQISGSYFMLLGQRKQLLLQQNSINDLTQLYQLQQYKIKIGKGDNSTLALLQQQLALSKAQIPQIENSIAATENALKILLGENPGIITTNSDIDNFDLSKIIPTNLSSMVLKNRPDVLMAENNLKMANANVGLANSMFFPTISLTGNIGGASAALSNLFSVGSGFWFVQAAANMPILNASNYEEINAAKSGYYVAYYNYMQTIKTAFADVDNNLTNLQKINEVYTSTYHSYQAVNKYYDLAQLRYQIGTQDKLSMFNAELQQDGSALALNTVKMQQLSSIVQTYQALAGGYAVVESGVVTNKTK